jgi:hypothetical protein
MYWIERCENVYRILVANPKREGHFGDLGIDRRIIL